MFSIICVYNNRELLEDLLLASIQRQSDSHELILIDNTGMEFRSASKALNWGAREARGKYLMFVHQDMQLCSDTWLRDAEAMLDELPDFGMAGVAGTRDDGAGKREYVTNIVHGVPAKRIEPAVRVEEAEVVQTLDECLTIVPRSVFGRLQFDEATCADWHLYGVDYCLSVAQLGLKVYVLPFPTYHRSVGMYNFRLWRLILGLGELAPGYYRTLRFVLAKHRDWVRIVYATTGVWNTRQSLLLQRFRVVARIAWKGYIRPRLSVKGWMANK